MASYSRIGQQPTSLPVRASALQERVFVAAIDFGTTYSGYAFQSRAEFEENPLSVKTNNWRASTSGLSHKTPSCILFNKDKHFDSFGLDAETKYNQAAAEGQTWSWYFFKRFKMLLYNEQALTRATTLHDDKNLEMPAMEVFTASIKYLKGHLLQSFIDKNINIKPEEIHWVITVPAIWTDSAKKFMREAAINAEIDTDRLSLSLEPEAASLFCRYLPVERVAGVDRAEIRCFAIGERYMILDAGGGTVDITVHEILEDSTLKEFAKSNGGEWGGTKVDEKFEQMLNDVFGLDVMEVIQQRYRDDYLDVMQNFEIKKRKTAPEMSGQETFQIPLSFMTTYKELNNVDIDKSTLIPGHLKGKITFSKDKMRVDAELVKGLFTEVCDQICAIAEEFFQSISQYNVNKILMVGGFSESPMLQDKVRKTFPKCRLVIPEEAGLAVLKGAVLFGHNPKMIVARVCKYSYGIRAFKHYESGIDPKDKRVVQGDVALCKDFFSKHATVGQEFNTEAKVYSQEYLPSDSTGTELEVWVYTSPNKHPMYIDDEGCRKLGEMRINLKDLKGKGSAVKIQFEFGKTELEVKVIDAQTKSEVKSANFDILH